MTGQEWIEFLNARGVSRETFERFQIYGRLVQKWNPAINLVSKLTLPYLWTRHFLDSAQIFDLADANIKRWVDVGSGGGFPGLVVAILAAEEAPDLGVTLVESDARKATFLSAVAQEVGIDPTICNARIEELAPQDADVLSARALAPLARLLPLASRHLRSSGAAIFPKGETYQKEIEEGLESWRFDLQKHASMTDANASVLVIRGLSHV